MKIGASKIRGISLLDVAMSFAAVSILVSFTVPTHLDTTVRQRVDLGMALAEDARLALEHTCRSNASAVVSDNLDAGYFYIPSGGANDYARRILLGADCAAREMAIVLWTTHTGAAVDPVLEWAGEVNGEEINWTCHLILGDVRHVPGECRNSYQTS